MAKRKAVTPQRAQALAGGRQALARRLAGVKPKAKLPPKGTPERTRYQSALRAIQRAEAAGKINPATGKPLQARASARVLTEGEAIAAERRVARKKQITLRNVHVTTTINGDRRYQRVRPLGDVTLTRAQYRYLKQLDRDQDDELLAQLMANVSPRIDDLAAAPGVQSLDISDVRFSGMD